MSKVTFPFGRNWQNYVKSLDDDSLHYAKQSLVEFLGIEDLKGRSFLDIGCGSGFFSYAAFKFGAEKVVSFDTDPLSVRCCRDLHEIAGNPSNWEIHEGSILDGNFISKFQNFDIVYSWGVLHHTGSMWKAVMNSAMLTAKEGHYYISIYNKVKGLFGSRFWLAVKTLYNASPAAVKSLWEAVYIMAYFFGNITRFQNPLRKIKNYKSKRGMNWRTDIVDWLGGYPYEFAAVEEIYEFVTRNFPHFELIRIKPTKGLGTNWFLFKNNGG